MILGDKEIVFECEQNRGVRYKCPEAGIDDMVKMLKARYGSMSWWVTVMVAQEHPTGRLLWCPDFSLTNLLMVRLKESGILPLA